MIALTIDGRKVETQKGKRILEAALDNGIYIPNLCAIADIELPFGACRLCFVEIEGQKAPVTACTEPVRDGMIVRTVTPEITKMRRTILDFILSKHPHECLTCHRREICGPLDVCLRTVSVAERCVTCPKDKRCELQKVVAYVGLDGLKAPYAYRNLPVYDDPLIARDYNLCILCGKCVRVCQEVRGVGAIAFTHRGSETVIGTIFGETLEHANCKFCGACVDVCPVGALTERGARWMGMPDKVVATTCPYCGVGCQLTMEVKNNRIARVEPDPKGPANKGQACVKGKFGMDFVTDPARLTAPLIKKDGQFVEATWEEA
ncbi:MAG: 4Fe-4S dicluster domain-containing protein, partial [Chloroflexi bacterium]|nr:4Fe-4S dicluster domain-containing protein [Chloroflexota bacterium]